MMCCCVSKRLKPRHWLSEGCCIRDCTVRTLLCVYAQANTIKSVPMQHRRLIVPAVDTPLTTCQGPPANSHIGESWKVTHELRHL